MDKSNNLNEMNNLENYLKDKGIKYERFDNDGHFDVDLNTQVGIRHQIRFYLNDEEEQSIICHPYSYGYKEGLLKGMGTLFKREPDNVIGWMTADDIIERIEKSNINGSDSITYEDIKTRIDNLIDYIQDDKMTLEGVKYELKKLSKDLYMLNEG